MKLKVSVFKVNLRCQVEFLATQSLNYVLQDNIRHRFYIELNIETKKVIDKFLEKLAT